MVGASVQLTVDVEEEVKEQRIIELRDSGSGGEQLLAVLFHSCLNFFVDELKYIIGGYHESIT